MRKMCLKIIKFLCAHFDYDANGNRQSFARFNGNPNSTGTCSFCGKEV